MLKNKQGIEFANAILDQMDIEMDVQGEENIPSDNSRLIVVANHPLGALDALVLISVVGKKRPNIRIFARGILGNIEQLKNLLVSVDEDESQMQRYKRYRQIFTSDNTLLSFPAGICSRKKKGQVKDREWEKSFVMIAKKYQRNILPVYFDVTNSNRFYQIANLREFLRIPINLEKFLLIDELIKKKESKIPMWIGKPIHFDSLTSDFSPHQWAQKIQDITYGLKPN